MPSVKSFTSTCAKKMSLLLGDSDEFGTLCSAMDLKAVTVLKRLRAPMPANSSTVAVCSFWKEAKLRATSSKLLFGREEVQDQVQHSHQAMGTRGLRKQPHSMWKCSSWLSRNWLFFWNTFAIFLRCRIQASQVDSQQQRWRHLTPPPSSCEPRPG